MSCILKNCSIKNDDERMISCWLCHGLCHFKCSGLSTLVAESLSKDNGLHWCCTACRKIGVSFYRFFQGTITHFKEIQNEAGKLAERISTYGKLFEDFKSLDNLKSPPQSSPKRRKSSRINKETNEMHSVAPVNCAASLLSKSGTVSPKPGPVVVKPPDFPCSSSQIITGETLPVVQNYNKKEQQKINPATVNQNKENDGNISNTHRGLRVIPPSKHIFISRLASDTTAEEIDYYIKSKINMSYGITVHKFTYSQQRSITSFKISVPFDIFSQVVDPSFWPLHVLVREYEYNNNNRNTAHLPSRVSRFSKN